MGEHFTKFSLREYMFIYLKKKGFWNPVNRSNGKFILNSVEGSRLAPTRNLNSQEWSWVDNEDDDLWKHSPYIKVSDVRGSVNK